MPLKYLTPISGNAVALEATARSPDYCLNGFKDEVSDRYVSLDWYKSDLPIHPALLAMRVRSRINALAWLREPCCKKSALSLSKNPVLVGS